MYIELWSVYFIKPKILNFNMSYILYIYIYTYIKCLYVPIFMCFERIRFLAVFFFTCNSCVDRTDGYIDIRGILRILIFFFTPLLISG